MKLFQRIRRFSPSAEHYLFAGVLLIRLVNLARVSGSAFLLPARGDMQFYNGWARRIAAGQAAEPFAFYGLPGYAYFLALIYKACGYSPFIPLFLQALVDAGTAVLIYRLVLLVLRDDRTKTAPSPTRSWQIAALGAALGWAFFVPAQAYAVILMPTAGAVFAFWLVVWKCAHAEKRIGMRAAFFLSFLVGLIATAVATVLFVLPLLIAAAWRRTGRSAVVALVAMGAGVAIGTAPCWGHNYFFARDPVFLSAHSGVNFWIGNNPEANGYPRFPPGLRAGQSAMLEDSISVAETAAGRSLKRSEVSAFWSNKSREYIRQYPARWIELLAIKVRNFWNAFQYDDLSIVTALRERAVIFPGLYFGVVASLGMPGAFLFIWKRNMAARWIIVAVLLHLCALLPVFVTERYRMAAVPGLLVLAAAGLWTWHQALRFGPRSVIISYLALLGLSITLVAWPLRNPSLWALDAYNSGWQALETGNLALAEKNLLRARAYVSGNAETNFALGNLRLAQERWNDAAAFYRETLSIDPHHKGALNNLGVLAFDAHDFTHAREFFRAALAQNPRDAKTHFLLARTAFALGDRAAAEAELAEALRISPEQAEFIGFRTDVLKEPAP